MSLTATKLAGMKPFLLVSTRGEEEALDTEYQAYLQASGLTGDQLELAEFDLLGLPPLEPSRYAGVFVAGSPYGTPTADGYVSATQQNVQAELTDTFYKFLGAGTPVLATGTAMTILARVLGATISSDNAEFAELADIELTQEGVDDPVFDGAPHVFTAYANHGEAVDELPDGAVRLARSLYSPIQVFRYGDNVYATQFNPELDADRIARQANAFADAGDTGFGDVEALVSEGRHTEGDHSAAAVIRGFARRFAN